VRQNRAMPEPSASEIWREPVRGGYPPMAAISLTGRERLEAWRRGEAVPPPLFHLTGARPTNFGSGTADAEMPATGWLAASGGVITGGTLAILADIAFGCSVESQLPAATPYTTAELSLSFLRPARPGGILTAHGQAIHVGRSVGLSEVFMFDRETDRLLAHGTSRLTIFPPIEDTSQLPGESEPAAPASPGGPDPYLRPAPDGVIPQDVWDERSGIEILHRQLAGELPAPPLHGLFGIRPTEVGEGMATAAMPATEWLNSPARRLQGGTIAMLADFAMLVAAETTRPAGVALAGLDLKVNFLRPGAADGSDLVARAKVVHRGRTILITRAQIVNAEGKPVVLATGSSMYLPGRPASLGEVEFSASDAD
jgi:uncharacterized protein (TIGR00369 family)